MATSDNSFYCLKCKKKVTGQNTKFRFTKNDKPSLKSTHKKGKYGSVHKLSKFVADNEKNVTRLMKKFGC